MLGGNDMLKVKVIDLGAGTINLNPIQLHNINTDVKHRRDPNMGLFSKLESFGQAAVKDVESFSIVAVKDAKTLFQEARTLALATNVEVTKLKTELQSALVKSRDAHQKAIAAAETVLKEVTDEITKLEQAIVSHKSDMNAQANQIATVVAPATAVLPVATAEVVPAPV